MKSFTKDAVFRVSSKPFLLDVNTPSEGIPLEVYNTNKYGERIAHLERKGTGPLAKAGKSAVSHSDKYFDSFTLSFGQIYLS